MTAAIRWTDLREFTMEGQGWKGVAAPFDRFPARAQGLVREPVWDLSRHSSGLCARFVTDSPVIQARWSLRHPSLAMSHMAATGVSGVDLYVREARGPWRWAGSGRPEEFPLNEGELISGLTPESREYLLYLPLYNGVTAVEIGVSPGASVTPGPARPSGRERPVIFYGSSITQGGCAARPGMAHVPILGRWLDWPVINLGFSGNGTMDPEVAELMAEVDAAAYVIECLPNMETEQVAQRTVPLVDILRRRRPDTPILLVEDRTGPRAPLLESTRRLHAAKRAALRAAYEQLKTAGDPHLHYQSGEDFMGEDGEGTVDGSHPTDVGFLRTARCMLPLLREVLGAGAD